ncbi:MAG: efflux RND transporter periplasmic adaptor subunit [Deltaproteobacteria bacterium]|nr:efflux RND transporter periplasmic adaptor subunit [Deltaproteobacteria bacterium]
MDKFNFVKEGDYLKGDGVVSEPHSFDVIVSAKWKGRIYNWEYEQFEGRVRMTDEVVNGAGIDVAVAGPVSMDLSVELPGRVVLNSDMVAHVVSGLSGVVTEVRKNLGDTVNKGDVLVVLESRDLSELKGGFLIAVKKLELAVESFKREEILREKKISAEQDYLASKMELARAEIEEMAASMKLAAVGLSPGEIKKLRKGNAGSLARYEIRAPFDGTVIEKSVSLGEAFFDNSDIYVIADLSSVWVEVPVHRNEMASAVLGKDVVVRSKFLNKEAKGKITYVSPLAGEKIQTATARVVLDNAGGEWRPGLYVDVILMKESIEAPVAVPVEAIQSFRDWTVVFVRYDDVFEMHPVELGRGDGRWVEILDGLSSGEKYAVKNSFVLKAEIGKAGATHDH